MNGINLNHFWNALSTQGPSFIAAITPLTRSEFWKLVRSIKHYHFHLWTLLLVWNMLFENLMLFCKCFLCGPVDGAWSIRYKVLYTLLFPSAVVPVKLLFVVHCKCHLVLNSCYIMLPKMVTYTKGWNDCDKFVSTEKDSMTWLAQPLLSFSEAFIDGLERNQDCSVARDIPHFPPVCAYQWAQIPILVATSLWICVFWSEAILLA